MPKNKHHYVPRFYLKLFGSSDTQINMCNFSKSSDIQKFKGVSLRKQCHKHKFYGNDDIENGLSMVEGRSATLIRRIISTSSIPLNHRDTAHDYVLLLYFVALQLQRTSKASEKSNEYLNTLIHLVLKVRGHKNLDASAIKITHDYAAIHALAFVNIVCGAMTDLKMVLVCASDNQYFITSDNPVVVYNQFYENIDFTGSSAPIVRGVQIFLPLSPKHTLVLFDPSVYDVYPRPTILYAVPDSDIEQINMLQAVGAEHNVYFDDWNYADAIYQLCAKAVEWRAERKFIGTLSSSGQLWDDNFESIFLHCFERTPNLKLALSFLTLKPEIARMTIAERLEPSFQYRKLEVVGLLEKQYMENMTKVLRKN